MPVFTEITEKLLREVDAVDVVTPIETHFEIVKKCFPGVAKKAELTKEERAKIERSL